MIMELLNLEDKEIKMTEWEKIVETIKNPKGKITVGIVGKYVKHQDAYKSVFEALDHGALAHGYQLEIKRFEADKVMKAADLKEGLGECDGYLIPGGFGERGWEGKIQAAKFCRENKIPYLGICLGMQVMSVEFARYAAKIEDANTTEVDPGTSAPIISLLNEQQQVSDMGGTMRLGAQDCLIEKGTKAYEIYGSERISERHRHRYEFNNKYKEQMEKAGLRISGTHADTGLCEIVEVKDHPWMVGVQFHPEFKSKPTDPHPLFRSFIGAVIKGKKS